MKPKLKEHKGITLVALILTIIVLLILAVVAISAVKGDGIISHAKNARDLYAAKSEEENALLQNYLKELNKETNGGSSSDDGKETGGGTTPTEPTVTVNDSIVKLTKANVYQYLGKKVTNYTGQSKVTIGDTEYTVSPTYRLYYVDFDNKYGDGEGTIYLKAECTSNIYYPDLDTSSDTATNVKIKALNPSLYATEVTSPDSSNSYMQSVTWLTNTTNWASLADTTMSGNINYIVGSPSLEMMMDSYNTHYQLTGDTPYTGTITEGTRKKLFYKYTSGTDGYQVGPSNHSDAESGYYTYTSDNSVYTESEIDSMYYPGAGKFYWLSSPTAGRPGEMFVLCLSGGIVGNDEYGLCDDGAAFCPVVSLKSNVKLQLQ